MTEAQTLFSRRVAAERESPGRVLLVEDGESRIALAAARGLRTAGWQVSVATPQMSHASISRYTMHRYVIRRLEQDPVGFRQDVTAAISHGGQDLVFGVGDAEVLALSAARDDFEACLPYPEHACVVAAIDKVQLTAAARSAGLSTPAVYSSPAQVGPRESVIVKPRLNGRVGHRGTTKIEARLAKGAVDAARMAAGVTAAGGEPLIQAAVQGDLLALILLIVPDGRVIAAVQQRADRLYPPHVGISARSHTESVDAGLERRAVQMLSALGWWGVAELQFVMPDNGEPVLIDLNGRFYGSLSLALAASVNFPDLWARSALGLPTPVRTEARPGVRYQWLEGDLRRALVARDGGLLRDVACCFAAAPSCHHSMSSLQDPVPALRQASRLARSAVASRLAGLSAT